MPSIITGEIILKFKLTTIETNESEEIEIVIKGSEFGLEEFGAGNDGEDDHRQFQCYKVHRNDYDLKLVVEILIYIRSDGISMDYEIKSDNYNKNPDINDEYHIQAELIDLIDDLEIDRNPNFSEDDLYY